MADYIEKGAAKYAVDFAMELSDTEYDAICNSIDKVPSADVAPVVRCKDCEFVEACSIREAMECTDENGFCWRAERRRENGCP